MTLLPPKTVLYKGIIELRLLSPKDGHAIFAAVQESMPSLKKFMLWAHFNTDLAGACDLYADFEAKSLKGSEFSFAGFDVGTGEFIFCASLSPGSRLNPKALDMGYWVSSKHQNRGMGTVVAKILTVLAFRHFGVDRLSVTCNPENVASLKVIKNCGFYYEGLLRNYHSKPSDDMIKNGFSACTDASLFSLVPEDLPQLSWFKETDQDLVTTTFYNVESKAFDV